jgi:hypothetical protein
VRVTPGISSHCRKRQERLFVFAAMWVATLRGQQGGVSPSSLPTLTRAEQIRPLTTDEAKGGYPVRPKVPS